MSSKVLPLGVAALAAGTSYATFLTSTGSGLSGDSISLTSAPTVFLSEEELLKTNWKGYMEELKTAKDISKNYKKIECLKDKLEDVRIWDDKKSKNSSLKVSDVDFSRQSSSCLIVDYYKKKYRNGKWTGELKLVWSIDAGRHGFMTVVHAKAENTKLTVDASVYIMKKAGKTLNVDYHKNVKKESANKKEALSLIPKSGALIKYTDFNKYWGFDPDINNICGKECKSQAASPSKSSIMWKSTSAPGSDWVIYLFEDLEGWLRDNFQWNDQILNKFISSVSDISTNLAITNPLGPHE